MAKVYMLIGCFLLGVSLSGVISFTASTFPQIRPWAFFLTLLLFGVFAIAFLFDDAIAKFLGIEWISYIALVVGVAATLLVGGFLQWFL